MTQTYLSTGRDVLRLEAEALMRLADDLPPGFDDAVARMLACPGRVVVVGVGKSGHVGHKIAATLASTGTPAVFVHGGEAAHGDLGMITGQDLCLMISNSGETPELAPVMAYCTRFAVPVIVISSRPNSSLMRAATLPLPLPDVPEACALRLAPTTSTTLTMALGDALAVACMTARGFRPDQFRAFHPGGKLGAQLLRVADLMHGAEDLPLVRPDTPMAETLLVMSAKGFGIAAVVDAQGRLAGVVSDGDLRRHMDGLATCTAGDIATPDPVTVTADLLAAEALARLNARKISELLVVDSTGAPQGVLHIHDCLKAGVV